MSDLGLHERVTFEESQLFRLRLALTHVKLPVSLDMNQLAEEAAKFGDNAFSFDPEHAVRARENVFGPEFTSLTVSLKEAVLAHYDERLWRVLDAVAVEVCKRFDDHLERVVVLLEELQQKFLPLLTMMHSSSLSPYHVQFRSHLKERDSKLDSLFEQLTRLVQAFKMALN